MNRIYKLIWSKVKNCYVVASELAKSHSKGCSGRRVGCLLAAGAVVVGLMLPMGDAEAFNNMYTMGYEAYGGEDLYKSYTQFKYLDNHIEEESWSYINSNGGVYKEHYNSTSYTLAQQRGNVTLGNYAASAKLPDNDKGRMNATFLQEITEEEAQQGWYTSRYDDNNKQHYFKRVYGGQIVKTEDKMFAYYGWGTDSSGNYGECYYELDENYQPKDGEENGRPKTLIVYSSLDLPDGADISGNNNIAIGTQATATGQSQTAIGSNSNARGFQSIAIGAQAEAGQENAGGDWNNGTSAVAIGDSAKAYGGTSVAVGSHAQTWSFSGIAVGNSSNAGTEYSIAIGDNARVEYVNGAEKDDTKQIAVHGIAIGRDALVEGKDATAVGRQSRALMRNATAYGNNAHADAFNSVAIGNKAIAGDQKDTSKGESAVAVGNRATALDEYTTAIGASTFAKGTHSVAVGDSNRALGKYSTAMGAGWSLYKVDEDDNDNTEAPREYESIGANQATGDYSTAVGYRNATTGDNSTALGMQNAVSGNNSIGIGTKNIIGSVTKPGDTKELTANTDKGNVTGFALGNENEITGNNSIAIGVGNKVSGENSGAFGDPNIVNGNNSYVVGNNSRVEKDANEGFIMGNKSKISGQGGIIAGSNSEVTAKDSVAIGNRAKATIANSVALGSGSETTHMGGLNGKKEIEIPGTNTKYTNVTGESPVGTVSVGKPGEERTITNVAAGRVGPGSTDAINGSELYAVEQQVVANSADIVNLSNRIDKVGAGAAALAGLHPLDFDPDEKWDFAASVGSYKSEQAVAIGAFYRPNEDTMFSIAGTIGDGRNMVNVGVSWKFGQKNRISANRISSAKEIIELRKNQENVHSFLADAVAGNQLDLSKIQLFPDVEENHWAYDYVATMAGNGVLEGYPDGYFKGNRNMTRYEMAAVLYRLMQNGARLSDKALTEFAPELDRIRVDTITHHKDGTPHIQRVRTIKERVEEKPDPVYKEEKLAQEKAAKEKIAKEKAEAKAAKEQLAKEKAEAKSAKAKAAEKPAE